MTRVQVLDARGVARALERMAAELIEHVGDETLLYLVGVQTRGVPLARRLARLVAGADFAAAAREAACDRFAAAGGDLGLVHQGSLDAQLDAVAFALRAGEISAPVRTPRGWHLLRCEAVTPARQATLAEVERSVAAGLLQRRRAALVEELDARLRREATVVVRGAP